MDDTTIISKKVKVIIDICNNFGISVVFVKAVQCPSFICYTFKRINIKPGTNLSEISKVENDIALGLASPNGWVRITSNTSNNEVFINIEIPNQKPNWVPLNTMIEKYKEGDYNYKLPIPLGIDEENKERFADLVDLQHILIAGQTGSGKSNFHEVLINFLIGFYSPTDLKLFLADPKRVEFAVYNPLPHLLPPVLVEPESILNELDAIDKERLTRLISPGKNFPYILIIIDTFSDISLYNQNRFESLIKNLTTDSDQTKIHVVMCDSRPSVDLFTPNLKACFPTKIVFRTSSEVDSRVAIGYPGAEKLNGRGDMLYLVVGQTDPIRLQAPLILYEQIKSDLVDIRNKYQKIISL